MKMKKIYKKSIIPFLVLLFIGTSCSDNVMDKIDENPNSPTDVPLSLLLPAVTMESIVGVTGSEIAWYSSVFVEHTSGVHGQMEDVNKRVGINSSMVNNSWNAIYADVLIDVDAMIKRGSEGGEEEGNWTYVGIAKYFKAYNLSVATDIWGKIPYTEATQGSENRNPAFNDQQFIYSELQTLLDEAIADFDKEAIGNPGSVDLIYGGDVDLWKKAAYALKARLYNRLSKRDPSGSATSALEAIEKSFTSAAESMIFTKFENTATGEHPWFQESNDRKHHALSVTVFNLMKNLNDPRLSADYLTLIDGEIVPAPMGRTVQNDQAGIIYSRASAKVLNATAPMPVITFDELKFIEAEAQLRLGNTDEAYTAYQDAVEQSLLRMEVAQNKIDIYLQENTVSPGAENLTLQNIIHEKYLSFWLFQPIEAYNDYRRTGYPAMNNDISAPPRRYPYTIDEISANPENVPTVTTSNGVWWDDGTEE